jgi:hypothetical protein
MLRCQLFQLPDGLHKQRFPITSCVHPQQKGYGEREARGAKYAPIAPLGENLSETSLRKQ